jgi:Circularly permutated YpsA SLOG family
MSVASSESMVAALVAEVKNWLERTGVRILNVAGPRESKKPGAYQGADGFLVQVLAPAARLC